MKNKIKLFVAVFLLLAIAQTGVMAASIYSGNFQGSTSSSWGYVVNPSVNIVKDNAISMFAVDWKYSNQSNHKQWFRLVNSNGDDRGSGLVNYLSTDTIDTSAQMNFYYWLQSKRESIFNPTTYVEGTWAL